MKRQGFVNSFRDQLPELIPMFRRATHTLLGWVYLSQLFSTLATPVVVATYNVENFHIRPYGNRSIKSEASRTRVTEVLLTMRPDILALQEMGESIALDSLQESLRGGGLSLPYREHLGGSDTNIFVALLSRFPIISRRPHTNDSFVLDGRRFHCSRSTIEVEIEVAGGQHLTVLTTHLKSKRPVPIADEAELREQEARILREHIDEWMVRHPNQPLIVCGDFNDTPPSKPIRLLIATGRRALFDPRPAETGLANADDGTPDNEERRITWTHFYPADDTYSRIDYLLMNRALRRFWLPEKSYVFASPHWGEASDHRPVVCTFDLDKN